MKILVLTSRFPLPLNKGDRLRAYYQLKELSRTCDIALFSFCLTNPTVKEVIELKEICTEVHFHKLSIWEMFYGLIWAFITAKPLQVGLFHSTKAKSKIDGLIEVFKAKHIYIQLIRIAEYAIPYTSIKKTLDFQDALGKGMERRAKNANSITRWFYTLEMKRLFKYENKMFQYFDNLSIITEQDKQAIKHSKKARIQTIKNGVDFKKFQPVESAEKSYQVLFTGNMKYPPNADAGNFLLNEIMPLVWKEIPDAKLCLGGINPPEKWLSLKKPNVLVTGWIDNINELYQKAEVFIAPMRIGTGLQNKLLEAMATRLPCITTPLAFNAFEDENTPIVTGESANDLASHIIRLLKDTEAQKELAMKARTYVLDKYSWEAATEGLIKCMHS